MPCFGHLPGCVKMQKLSKIWDEVNAAPTSKSNIMVILDVGALLAWSLVVLIVHQDV